MSGAVAVVVSLTPALSQVEREKRSAQGAPSAITSS
jgi:hypothetical protein